MEAADNDKQRKENLKTFESTVTAQGADTEKQRSQAQDSLKEVAACVETLRLGDFGAAAGQGAESASLELKMVAFELRVDYGLKKLESLFGETRKELKLGAQRPRWTS